jgi:hypothetical protein
LEEREVRESDFMPTPEKEMCIAQNVTSMIHQRVGLYTDSCKGFETYIKDIKRIGYDDLERMCMEQKH